MDDIDPTLYRQIGDKKEGWSLVGPRFLLDPSSFKGLSYSSIQNSFGKILSSKITSLFLFVWQRKISRDRLLLYNDESSLPQIMIKNKGNFHSVNICHDNFSRVKEFVGRETLYRLKVMLRRLILIQSTDLSGVRDIWWFWSKGRGS